MLIDDDNGFDDPFGLAIVFVGDEVIINRESLSLQLADQFIYLLPVVEKSISLHSLCRLGVQPLELFISYAIVRTYISQ